MLFANLSNAVFEPIAQPFPRTEDLAHSGDALSSLLKELVVHIRSSVDITVTKPPGVCSNSSASIFS